MAVFFSYSVFLGFNLCRFHLKTLENFMVLGMFIANELCFDCGKIFCFLIM